MRDKAAKKLEQLKRLTRAQTIISHLAKQRSLEDNHHYRELDEKMQSLDELVRSDVKVSIFSSLYVGHLQKLARKKVEAQTRLAESNLTSHRENSKLKILAEREDKQRSLLSRLSDEESLSAVLESWKGSSG